MKKLLISVILVLLIILLYFSMAKGINIGGLKVLGITGLKDQNNVIVSKLNETNRLINTEYPKKMSDLESSIKALNKSKEDYNDLTLFSSESEVEKAAELKSYYMEFLWAKIENHATKEGIVMKMQVTNSSQIVKNNKEANNLYDINFTTTGNYIGTALFISSLENDSFLNFKIENFRMLPTEDGELQSTFTVKGIRINLGKSTNTNVNNVPSSDNANLQQNEGNTSDDTITQ